MDQVAKSKKMDKGDWIAALACLASFAFLGLIPALFW